MERAPRSFGTEAASRTAAIQAVLPSTAPGPVDRSPRGAGLQALAQLANHGPAAVAQRRDLERLFGPALQRQPDAPPRANEAGLPDALKSGVEALSGLSLDGVRVHRNSAKPAQLRAQAYAQGHDIHLGPGQDHHLPHEAWHVVQQAQGRVRPTMQMKEGVPVNDDAGLEAEADVMGARALQMSRSSVGGPAPGLRPLPSVGAGAPVQGLFDWAYPNRKMGVEVTEATAGANLIQGADPTPGFAALGAGGQAALWQAVNLPDSAGAAHVWRAATFAAAGGYFNLTLGKPAWMRWGNVSMTEDSGEFEWIVHHPAAPQNMGYYRTQLNVMNQSRQAMRAALGVVGNDLIVATNPHPAGPGQAFRISMGATQAASAQITFESTSAAKTKKVLYEGVSHGLNKRTRPNQTTLHNVTPDIVAAAQTSAARIATPGVDTELLMAYLYGDLIHKIATLQAGAVWAVGMAGNIKNWRNLFPKSKPYQVTMQAFGRAPTVPEMAALAGLMNGAQAAIVDDVTTLFVSKLPLTARALWHPLHFNQPPLVPGGPLPPQPPDPASQIFNAANAVPGAAPTAVNLRAFLLFNGLNMNTEFDHVRDGFTTPGAAFVPQVVRSNDAGFAQHGAGTSGFATEDRGEVGTTFPGLDTVYARVKTLAWRF